jgi:ferrous iron transport protein B
MATRTLENRKDRFMTVFMTPFMSCGARLPVYALFAAAFFPAAAGSVVFSIYLVGIREPCSGERLRRSSWSSRPTTPRASAISCSTPGAA